MYRATPVFSLSGQTCLGCHPFSVTQFVSSISWKWRFHHFPRNIVSSLNLLFPTDGRDRWWPPTGTKVNILTLTWIWMNDVSSHAIRCHHIQILFPWLKTWKSWKWFSSPRDYVGFATHTVKPNLALIPSTFCRKRGQEECVNTFPFHFWAAYFPSFCAFPHVCSSCLHPYGRDELSSASSSLSLIAMKTKTKNMRKLCFQNE